MKPRSLRDKLAYGYCLLGGIHPPEKIHPRGAGGDWWQVYRADADHGLEAIKKSGLVLAKRSITPAGRAALESEK